jgi:hypothetical protein
MGGKYGRVSDFYSLFEGFKSGVFAFDGFLSYIFNGTIE